MYKDPNHKPEMAIALTSFEALCGFRDVADMMNLVVLYPEFSKLIGDESIKYQILLYFIS